MKVLLCFFLLAVAVQCQRGEAAGPVKTSNETTAVAQMEIPRREHPFLFLDKDGYRRVARRGTNSELPWAVKQYNSIIKTADAALDSKLEIPALPGEWVHHYVCKDCGIRLKHVNDKHKCPRCGREYSGWPYEGVAAGLIHAKNINNARHLGLAWQLTGREEYAARARETLLGYADVYENFPIHDYRGGQAITGARLMAQTLSEAVRMIPAAWAYDLIADAPGTTDAHREKIVDRLLKPAAGIIARNDKGISNWQSWHNAAIAAIGYVTGDAELVRMAVDGPSGIRFQMEKSVLEEGFWYEGTAAYHFYALNALQQQVLAMKAAGSDFHLDPVFRSMYRAPLDYMFPDGSFPAVNDSSPLPISQVAYHYELAYAWYGEKEYAAAAEQGNRDSLEAFLFGEPELPQNAVLEPGSRNFPGLGALMLRQNSGTDNATALHLDYGPHGGGHGHYDKLGIVLFANEREVMPDAGRLLYGAPLHKRWYIRSIAHNTVIVDGKDQEATEGRLISKKLDGTIQMANAVCDTAYKDVTLTRSVALAPEYLLDVVSGAGKKQHTWDLAYHIYGEPEVVDLELEPVTLPQKKDGYQVLQNIRAFSTADMQPGDTTKNLVSVLFRNKDRKDEEIVGLWQADTGPRQVILADGIAGTDVTTCPVVLWRQEKVKSAEWITLINPRHDQQEIRMSSRSEGDKWYVTVHAQGRDDNYVVQSGELSLSAGN